MSNSVKSMKSLIVYVHRKGGSAADVKIIANWS